MGTTASLQKDESSQKSRKPVTAHSVRERLRHEYYGDDGAVLENNEDMSGIGMTTLPSVLKAKGAFMKTITKGKRRESNEDANLIKKQDNNALLKEIFGRIDPSAVSGSYGKYFGEIEVALKYKSNESTLLVKIGRARNLPTPDVHKLPDPFVQAALVIKRLGSQMAQINKTRTKPGTQNPLFQEIFTFDLLQADLVDAILTIDVWNKDSISQDDFLGETVLELYKEEVNGGVASWHNLRPHIDLDITGHIEVTLEYDDTKLYVLIHQASQLKSADKANGLSNPYVRCYVTGVPNREETQVVVESLDPVFEETFEYEILPENLNERVLVLAVLHKETTGKDARLGDVHIPLRDVNFFNPQKISYALADLRNTQHSRSKWSEEGLSQEFKEAMRAHAIYKYPHCLFKGQHSGRKLVTVNCTKARTSAKMTVINGLPIHD